MVISIVGTGLIGGSMAINFRHQKFCDKIIGVDASEANAKKALQLGLVDEIQHLDDALAKSDIIILAIPVNALKNILPDLLDKVDKQVVMEVGSTKERILEMIKGHPKRSRLVATHPMAGTEYSGPEAAIPDLFKDRSTVLCDIDDSDPDAVEKVKQLYAALGSRIIYMDAVSHDLHAAYVSHISHITSFALAVTVLEKEKEDEAIFELASGGFASTVRLAKSSPDMWVPIFQQNRHNVLDVLYEHIHQLKRIKQMLVDEDYEGFYKLIQEANDIRKIIK
jgi:prephenate dehydrogenase